MFTGETAVVRHNPKIESENRQNEFFHLRKPLFPINLDHRPAGSRSGETGKRLIALAHRRERHSEQTELIFSWKIKFTPGEAASQQQLVNMIAAQVR